MPLDALDLARMQEALAAAEAAMGVSEPNPRVGCVIGHLDGRVLGVGSTQAVGGPHAEVMALRDAQARGESVVGACAWVTLEPCAHHGRTPPCCDALLAAGIRRVVIGVRDPNPRVDGAGAERLAAHGVDVLWAPPDIAAACREINIGFFSRLQRGRPWVRMKAACSADGRVAQPDGTSQWITGPAAREDGHRWRLRADAVLTGVGTVVADDPWLNVRLPQARRQPLRVVVDSAWRTPPSARLFTAPGPVLIVGTAPTETPAARRLADAGAELLRVEADSSGRVAPGSLLSLLARREVNELHLEAGPALNGAMLAGGWVDEWLFYVAPRLIGAGLPPARLDAGEPLDQAPRWVWHSMAMVGDDLRLVARRRTAHSRGVDEAYSAASQPPGAAHPGPGGRVESVDESTPCRTRPTSGTKSA